MAKKKTLPIRPTELLRHRARALGCVLASVGDYEQLAGIDLASLSERQTLWGKFRHLFYGPADELFNADMDYCSTIALQRLDAGEFCLLPAYWHLPGKELGMGA